MDPVKTRSGRVSKPPERYSPVEEVTDDYDDGDYTDDEDPEEEEYTDDEDPEDEEESDDDEDADENGNLKGFVVDDEEEEA